MYIRYIIVLPDDTKTKMWTMWQGWKDEEQLRIRVEQDYARLMKTLNYVRHERDELKRERDELKRERDELEEHVKRLKQIAR